MSSKFLSPQRNTPLLHVYDGAYVVVDSTDAAAAARVLFTYLPFLLAII
jgi:hypothetical protein